jgi:hypothetical protein
MTEEAKRQLAEGSSRDGGHYETRPKRYTVDEGRQLPLPELQQWLKAHDDHLYKEMIRKAVEYGASDFKVMGQALAGMIDGEVAEGEDRVMVMNHRGQLMAVAFYMLGKIARMTSAFERGELPGIDSAMDIEQYAKIYQKIAETGRWI